MITTEHTLHLPATALPPRARVDLAMSKIVELGIAEQAAYGTVCALEYLKSYRLAPELIERVLSRPAERRQLRQ